MRLQQPDEVMKRRVSGSGGGKETYHVSRHKIPKRAMMNA